MNKKQAAQARPGQHANSKKSSKESYNNLVGNLGNQLDQQAAQFFGKLLKNGKEGALSFANAESGKHVALRTEKALSARTRLVRAGLITARAWPTGFGADYQVTDKGFQLVEKYWPTFRARPAQVRVTPTQRVQQSTPKWVVVPPVRTVAANSTSVVA